MNERNNMKNESKYLSKYPEAMLYNAVRTPDGTILCSTHGWDYREHLDAITGETYMVDSGNSMYYRRSINDVPAVDMSVTTYSPFSQQRKVFTWGTYGKDGKGERTEIALCNMSTAHIEAVLRTQSKIKGTYVEELMINELEYRLERGIVINDND